MKSHLSIGELGSIFKINVQTLRYYDSIGLLKPESRDASSKYRKYRFDQVYALATIRYLRRLDYSLENITSYIESRDINYTLQQLKNHADDIERKHKEFKRMENAIRCKIAFVESELKNNDFNSTCIRHFDQRYYSPLGPEDMIFQEDSFYLNPTIVFYTGENKTFCSYLYDYDDAAELYNETHNNVQSIRDGDFLCAYHKGRYEDIQESISKMRNSHKELKLNDTVIAINIIDQFVEKDRAKFLTLIQIRIMWKNKF